MTEETPINTPFPPSHPTVGGLCLPPPPKLTRQVKVTDCYNSRRCPLRLMSVLNQFTYCILRRLLNCEQNYEYDLHFRNEDILTCRKEGVMIFVFLHAEGIDIPIEGWMKRNKQFIQEKMDTYGCYDFRVTVAEPSFLGLTEADTIKLVTPIAHHARDKDSLIMYNEPEGRVINIVPVIRIGSISYSADHRWDSIVFTAPPDVIKYHEMAEVAV